MVMISEYYHIPHRQPRLNFTQTAHWVLTNWSESLALTFNRYSLWKSLSKYWMKLTWNNIAVVERPLLDLFTTQLFSYLSWSIVQQREPQCNLELIHITSWCTVFRRSYQQLSVTNGHSWLLFHLTESCDVIVLAPISASTLCLVNT